MGTLPMTFHGRDARLPAAGLRQAGATSKAERLTLSAGFFPPISEGLLSVGVLSARQDLTAEDAESAEREANHGSVPPEASQDMPCLENRR
jgi:hypothetical protein